ncbi:MAG TPA: IPT/TIG domain-containing protein, partial [Bryobacteraceae bacterium]
VSIFGQSLAAASHALGSSDLVNGNLPTTLAGVSVQVDNQPAFLQYVSPSQINAQAPADSNTGSVRVTVTNSGGTSDAVTVNLQSMQPAFFTSQNYVAAARVDGAIIGAGTPAKSGDVLQLYGTGFGPTNPAVSPGSVFQGSFPLANTVKVSIGGADANVSYSGLVGAGLCQINVTVPALADGDHAVLAQVAGVSAQTGVLLKVKN